MPSLGSRLSGPARPASSRINPTWRASANSSPRSTAKRSREEDLFMLLYINSDGPSVNCKCPDNLGLTDVPGPPLLSCLLYVDVDMYHGMPSDTRSHCIAAELRSRLHELPRAFGHQLQEVRLVRHRNPKRQDRCSIMAARAGRNARTSCSCNLTASHNGAYFFRTRFCGPRLLQAFASRYL